MTDRQVENAEKELKQWEKDRLNPDQIELDLCRVDQGIEQSVRKAQSEKLEEEIRASGGPFAKGGIEVRDVNDLYVQGELDKIPEDARRQVVSEVRELDVVTDRYKKGFKETDFAKMGDNYKDIYRRYFEKHINNIRGIEHDGKILVNAGRHHIAYAQEMGVKELPVEVTRTEWKEVG